MVKHHVQGNSQKKASFGCCIRLQAWWQKQETESSHPEPQRWSSVSKLKMIWRLKLSRPTPSDNISISRTISPKRPRTAPSLRTECVCVCVGRGVLIFKVPHTQKPEQCRLVLWKLASRENASRFELAWLLQVLRPRHVLSAEIWSYSTSGQ